ncbi:hypothetical protein BDR05DRAFT_1005249 [Suillus weaverae]|nr:hypothetical protein BDR05DRAFT_1005249 [Suillus weaverae]
MVISTNSDTYAPFLQGIMMEDSYQSNEDGFGLHSPIFGAQFPQPHGHNIQHAAGILTSQFDYTNINIHPHPHLLETPSNFHSNQNLHYHNSYQSEFLLPQRNHLGLDTPSHAYPNTCLPLPPAHSAAISLFYQGPRSRKYFAEDLRTQSYSGGCSAQPPAMHTPENMRSSIPTSESTPQLQPAAPTSQDLPHREISNQVIACQQCRAKKIRCDSARPICHNCVRRSNECQYDAAPKRRGPDKRPGTRQRSCKKRLTDGSSPSSLPSKRKRTLVRNDDFELPCESHGLLDVPAFQPDGDRIQLQPLLSPTQTTVIRYDSTVDSQAALDELNAILDGVISASFAAFQDHFFALQPAPHSTSFGAMGWLSEGTNTPLGQLPQGLALNTTPSSANQPFLPRPPKSTCSEAFSVIHDPCVTQPLQEGAYPVDEDEMQVAPDPTEVDVEQATFAGLLEGNDIREVDDDLKDSSASMCDTYG